MGLTVNAARTNFYRLEYNKAVALRLFSNVLLSTSVCVVPVVILSTKSDRYQKTEGLNQILL
jgi:E3 ubiquitin-protein ligase DOA10